jgi:hypothetical protein
MKLKSFALGLGFAVLACVSTFAQTSYNFQTINYPHDTFTQLLAGCGKTTGRPKNGVQVS